MNISKIKIQNYRNFLNEEVPLSKNIVLVGENKAGKSNFINAMRLVLDSSLSHQNRMLSIEDFSDTIIDPLENRIEIVIEIYFENFGDNPKIQALLSDAIISENEAMFKYRFFPDVLLEGTPQSEKDYTYELTQGLSNNPLKWDILKRLPLDFHHALRDAVSDLSSWNRSPLRPLLESLNIAKDDLEDIGNKMQTISDEITDIAVIKTLEDNIQTDIKRLVGEYNAIDISFGMTPIKYSYLIHALQILMDEGKRSISAASLGTTNILYIVLKLRLLEQIIQANEIDYMFLVIDEPEAHLHPSVQRSLYEELLKISNSDNRSMILSTHSTFITSITPLDSLVIIKRQPNQLSVVSTINTCRLTDDEKVDIQRYLDYTRAEMLFARGVLLVEGIADKLILQVMFPELEREGIIVCSVESTNFKPYIKFLGTNGIQVPFVVITDKDPHVGNGKKGIDRLKRVLIDVYQYNLVDLDLKTEEEIFSIGERHNILFNNWTLEVELWDNGCSDIMKDIFIQLADNVTAIERVTQIFTAQTILSSDIDKGKQLLKDIESISKGRFAQSFVKEYIRRGSNSKLPFFVDAVTKIRTDLIG